MLVVKNRDLNTLQKIVGKKSYCYPTLLLVFTCLRKNFG